MVRVEGPFTLLSPREMDGLRALGVDLEHCDDWVVGGDGEALLTRAGLRRYLYVWRGVLMMMDVDRKYSDEGGKEYRVNAMLRVRDVPAGWYEADSGDVGLSGEVVEPDRGMLRVLAAMLRVYYRGWLSYGGVWPDGVIWEDVDRSGLKVREGGLVGPWDVPLTRYRARVPSEGEYAYAAGLSPEGFARRVKPGRAVMIDDAGRSVLWGIPVMHNPHGGGSGTMGGFIYDGVKYGWREVREDFARPVGERRVNARHVFFNRGRDWRDWYEPDAAFLRAYWDAYYACKFPLRLTYRGVSVDLPEILPGGSPA